MAARLPGFLNTEGWSVSLIKSGVAKGAELMADEAGS
jgi:hypothetical protein